MSLQGLPCTPNQRPSKLGKNFHARDRSKYNIYDIDNYQVLQNGESLLKPRKRSLDYEL